MAQDGLELVMITPLFLEQGLSIPGALPCLFLPPSGGTKGVCQHTWISHVFSDH